MKLFDSTTSLHDFMSNYIPSIWKEPIKSCCFVPYFSDEIYIQCKNKNYAGLKLTWYEREAIESFFIKLKEQE